MERRPSPTGSYVRRTRLAHRSAGRGGATPITTVPRPALAARVAIAHTDRVRIGLISDTHGWLDPAALDRFAEVDAILHAGDIMALLVVETLAGVAPTHAVRGNNDRTPDLLTLPERVDLELGGRRIHLVHRPQDARPGEAGVVVFGHTHKPLVEWRGGVLWVNPGAAGRRGFHRERTLALMDLRGERPAVEIVHLGRRSARAIA